MKKCPYCAEEIYDEAIECKYCGEELDKQYEIDLNGEHLTEYEKSLRDKYREMPIDSLEAFRESYNPEEYTLEAQRIIAEVFKERSEEFNYEKESSEDKKKITEEEFVIRAIKKLQGDSIGIHSEYSGFNQAFLEYYEKDPTSIIQLLSQKEKIIVKSVEGGDMLYLPEDFHHARTKSKTDSFKFDITIYSDNAYRILGIPFDASKKEIVQRVEEIQTLLKIGIPISYDTDIPWIGSLIRSEETIRNSFNVLNNLEAKLLHLFSWFWISDELDKSAINALNKKDINGAINLWSEKKKYKDIIRVKNLATLEHILIFYDSDKELHHLRNCLKYWRMFFSVLPRSNLVDSIDKELSGIITKDKYAEIIYTYLNFLLKPFLTSWTKESQINKTLNLFNLLKDCEVPEIIITKIRNEYTKSFFHKLDTICDRFSDVSDDPDECYVETKDFFEKVNPYFEQIKKIGEELIVNNYGDRIASLIISKAINYGNKSDSWEKAHELIVLSEKFISSPILLEKYEVNLETISQNVTYEKTFKDLTPIEEAPFIDTYFGIGTALYGRSNYDSYSRSYETTRYFVILGIPIFPIARYRVVKVSENYTSFLAKVPFRNFDKWHVVLALAAVFFGIIYYSSQSSSSNMTSKTKPAYSYQEPTSNTKTKPKSTPQRTILPVPNLDSHVYKNSTSTSILSLKRKIEEAEKMLSAKEFELLSLQGKYENLKNELDRLDLDIKNIEKKMDSGLYWNKALYESKINEYNNLVKTYNTTLTAFKVKYEEYENFRKKTNEYIEEYNNLIRKR